MLRCIAGCKPNIWDNFWHRKLWPMRPMRMGSRDQLSVLENLKFWADIYGGPRPEVRFCLYLEDLAHRPAANLSAGQKRRLGLARMLVTGCALWVMDEPTVSLDVQNVALFRTCVESAFAGWWRCILATTTLILNVAESLDLTVYIASWICHPPHLRRRWNDPALSRAICLAVRSGGGFGLALSFLFDCCGLNPLCTWVRISPLWL